MQHGMPSAGRLMKTPHLLPCKSWLPQVAISVLTDTTGAKRGMGKQQFLDHLADSLTAAEQVKAHRCCRGSRRRRCGVAEGLI